MKEALYVVHAEIERPLLDEWNRFHAREHVPAVVKKGGFAGAQRFRKKQPGERGAGAPPAGKPTGGGTPTEAEPDADAVVKLATVYRAASLGVVRGYLEGGQVGALRAQADKVAGPRARFTREVLEENYSVDSDGKPLARDPARDVPGRALFVVRVRVDATAAPAWSTWYDRDHLPKVAREGFLRAGRWRVVDDAAGAPRFVVIYEAPSLAAIEAFSAGPGPAHGREHQEKFAGAVSVEREIWFESE